MGTSRIRKFISRRKLKTAALVTTTVVVAVVAATTTGAVGSLNVFAATVTTDTCGYDPAAAPNPNPPPATVVFNENEVTRSVAFYGTGTAGHVGVFTNDERGLLIGAGGTPSSSAGSAIGTLNTAISNGSAVSTITVQPPGLKVSISSSDVIVLGTGGTTESFSASAAAAQGATSFSVTTKTATHLFATGTNIADSSIVYGQAVPPTFGSGVDAQQRPIAPSIFLTDITGNSSANGGDWEHGGTAANLSGGNPYADALYGSWTPTLGTNPVNQNHWTLGPNADTPPAGTTSFDEGYGAEVVWNVGGLKAFDPGSSTYKGLLPGHTYRVQSLTHGADQHHLGLTTGDVGEVCTTFNVPKLNPTTGTVVKDHNNNVVDVANPAPLGSKVHDTATVTASGPTATGTVTYQLYSGLTCSSNSKLGSAEQVTLSGGNVPNSSETAALQAGDYSYQAVYSGDASYNASTGPCEPFKVAKANSSTATVVKDHANNVVDVANPAALGSKVHDTATVTASPFTTTGTVIYHLYTGLTCDQANEIGSGEQVTLSGGNVPNSSETAALTAGNYSYQAVYSGDTNYTGSTGACEPFKINQASPSIITTQDPASGSGGDTYKDKATLSDGGNPTGTITFDLYDNPNCSGTAVFEETASVNNGNGTYETPNGVVLNKAGTYYWVATYGGDSNNTSAVSGCGDEPITVNPADIQILKKADHATVSAGEDVGFTITVWNDGAGDAKGTTLADPLPQNPGLSWSIDAQGAGWGGTCAINPAGTELDCGPVTVPGNTSQQASTFTVHITSGTDKTTAGTCEESSGVVDNTGNVSTTNDGSGSSEDQTCVQAADIKILKTADKAQVNVGDPIGFTITVWNAGSGDAKGVTLTDPLPQNSGLSWTIDAQGAGWGGTCAINPAGTTLTCGPKTVPGGTTQTASTFTVHATSPTTGATGGDCPETGVVDNTGTVTTTNDGSGSSGDTVCVQAVVDLAITKTGSPATQELGQGNITWTMVVTNNGPSDDTNVTVSDPMPAGNTFVSASTTQGTCTGGAILNCNIGFMAAGASVTITLITTPSQQGTQTNTAVVMGSRPESNLTNNTATASVEVTAPFVQPSCVEITKLTPGQLIVGRKTVVTIHLRRKVGPSVKGIKVRIKGVGINVKTKGANSNGVIKKTLKLKKKGILIFTPLASPSCGAKRIGVRGVFTPPVTG